MLDKLDWHNNSDFYKNLSRPSKHLCIIEEMSQQYFQILDLENPKGIKIFINVINSNIILTDEWKASVKFETMN